jgi:hypothetical protein
MSNHLQRGRRVPSLRVASKPGGTAGAGLVPLSRYAELVEWTDQWLRRNADEEALERWLELREFIVVKGTTT